MLILAIPSGLLFFGLDAIYGWDPLPAGQAAVVTAQLDRPLVPADARLRLEAPAGIAVETPAVRSMVDRQISWRVRPIKSSSRLHFSVTGSTGVAAVFVNYPRTSWLPWFLCISTLSAVVAALAMKL
jgi:hypothetical protein